MLYKLKNGVCNNFWSIIGVIKRNYLSKFINHYVDIDQFLPTIAQGVIGI